MSRRLDEVVPDYRNGPSQPFLQNLSRQLTHGATTIDFTTLSLEMDSVSSDFPDATRVQSPGMDMADLSCEEFAIQKTADAQQAKMIPVDKPGCNPLLSAVLTNDVAASARNLNYSGAQFGKSKKTALIVAADRAIQRLFACWSPVRQVRPPPLVGLHSCGLQYTTM